MTEIKEKINDRITITTFANGIEISEKGFYEGEVVKYIFLEKNDFKKIIEFYKKLIHKETINENEASEFKNMERSDLILTKISLEAYKQGCIDTFKILKETHDKTIELYKKKILICNQQLIKS